MDIASQLEQEIQSAQHRLEQLLKQKAEPTPALLIQTIEELTHSYEELSIALEELHDRGRRLIDREELFAQRRQYEDWFESAPDAYLITNPLGKIELANQTASRLLNVASSALVGKPLSVYIALASRSTFRAQLNQFEQTTAIHDWELDLQPQIGEALPVSIAVSGMYDEQQQWIGLRWSIRDITARKQLEASLARANAELEQRVAARTAELERTIAQLEVTLQARDQEMLERQRLWAELEQVRQAIAACPVGVVIADAQQPDCPAIYVNPAFEQQTGYTPVEVIGRNFRFLQGDDRDQPSLKDLRSALRAGESCTITVRNYHKDGTRIWVELTVAPIVDANGKITNFVGVQQDISDRVQVELERERATLQLAESESKFRFLVENLRDVIFTHTIEGKFTYLSPRFTDLFGYLPEEYLDRSFESLVHLEDLENFKQPTETKLMQGDKILVEFRHRCKDGSWRWVKLSATPVFDEHQQVIAIQGIILDIQERKQIEAQLRQYTEELEAALSQLRQAQTQLIQSEKMSSLGQLVAGVAHEINNPVSFIYGNLAPAQSYVNDLLELIQIYRSHYPNPPIEIAQAIDKIDLEFLSTDLPKLLNSMQTGADRIREIVLSLRNFSRLDEAEIKCADIHDGIDSTLMILTHRTKATSRRPEIKIVRQYSNLPLVECYVGQLNQVFMNLLSNAIDALEEAIEKRSQSTPMILISTQVIDQTHIRITISDNGMGISETTRQKIFDPFFTTKPIGSGTGMGLAISYKVITDRHHGSLECRSIVNQGAEFIIQIPIKYLQAPE